MRRVRGAGIGFVFQEPMTALDSVYSVGDQIMEALRVHGIGTRQERRERAADLFQLVGLDAAYLERYPHQFSGGQRQRIGLARALALNPQFVVLDEPVSALDVSVQAQVVNLLLDLQARLHLTYLFIAHDLRLVEHICRRIAVMYRGRIVERGDTAAIFGAPQHPYTRALLSAVPSLDPDAHRQRTPLDPRSFDASGAAKGSRGRTLRCDLVTGHRAQVASRRPLGIGCETGLAHCVPMMATNGQNRP